MARREGHSNGLDSLLGAGVDCQGTARVEGTLRLDGAFQGTLEVGDTLIIGQSGSFTGRARGRQVVVIGKVEGEVIGTERVELQKGARMDGDVLTRFDEDEIEEAYEEDLEARAAARLPRVVGGRGRTFRALHIRRLRGDQRLRVIVRSANRRSEGRVFARITQSRNRR